MARVVCTLAAVYFLAVAAIKGPPVVRDPSLDTAVTLFSSASLPMVAVFLALLSARVFASKRWRWLWGVYGALTLALGLLLIATPPRPRLADPGAWLQLGGLILLGVAAILLVLAARLTPQTDS